MANDTLVIAELPYLEEIETSHLQVGGYAQANTSTYTGPGVAVANADATAEGDNTLSRIRTNTTVRETKVVTISRASAFAMAISWTDSGVYRDVSGSRSINIAVNHW